MALRLLTTGDAGDVRRFAVFASFPPARLPPLADGLADPRVRKWLVNWGDELGVGWEENGELIGAAWARFTGLRIAAQTDREDLAEVLVAVDPEWRDRQIGTHLIGGLQALAVERGHRGFILQVSPINVAAVHMYERCGFITQDERDSTGAILMTWDTEDHRDRL